MQYLLLICNKKQTLNKSLPKHRPYKAVINNCIIPENITSN